LLPAGNIPEPSTSVTISLSPDTLYNSLKAIAAQYLLGFRLVRNGDAGQVYFEVYTGNDLTSDQSTLPAVIFSEDLNNLSDSDKLTSVAANKTVAYVFAPNGALQVYSPLADGTETGSARRILFVDASDITLAAGSALTTALQQRGLQMLAQNQTVYSFSGTVSQYSQIQYGVDYNLGDVCEERNSDGTGSKVMVTEQIFVSDNQGERSYPTLTEVFEIIPGTWSRWSGSEYWADVDSSITWGSLS
jgi:Siphovirus ReqiPepy6 Gp37-like protein